MTARKKTTAQRYADRILGERHAPDDRRPSWERHAERLRQTTTQPTEQPEPNQEDQ